MTVAQLIAEFEELYGSEPEGVWAAPGRVNLIGEYTDFNDGFVMPLALPHTAQVAVARRTDGVLRLHSGDREGDGGGGGRSGGVTELRVADLRPQDAPGEWWTYLAGVVWALRERGYAAEVAGGADVHLRSTVPTGAGLSSSAALEVALALALVDLYQLPLTRAELAQLCQYAENAFVGVPCGIMDQTASACCEAGHALHLDTRDLTRRQIPFDLPAHGLTLLVVDTRVQHALGDGAYAERRAGCEEGARQLGVTHLRDVAHAELDDALAKLTDERIRRYVRHVVSDNHRVRQVTEHLDAGDVRAIGAVLLEGHASLRDDLRISCPELDLVVETAARTPGVHGARMTGGGFGGSAIVLAEASAVTGLGDRIEAAFAAEGHRAPRVFPATPSAGARQLA
ncbi:galactokinase [Streptomyces sp. NPDC051561]|uniref:galactokinase n=1 Tax=Streptomyces sp. NPDC051561 TaxID=3365658 RepID=UPI00379F074B